AGDTARASARLQGVGASDESFRAATEILARLFLDTGRAGLAAERLQRAIGGQPVSSANIDLYYWLAIALEKDKPADAIATYKKVEGEAIGYRDVEARVAALEAGKPMGVPPRPAAAVSAARSEPRPLASATSPS